MFTFFRLRIGITIQVLALLILLSTTSTRSAVDWIEIRDGKLCESRPKLCGLSGMASLPPKGGQTRFLVVNDSRGGNDDYRLGIVIAGHDQVNYLPLKWPPNLTPPDDLEAISSLPDKLGQFLILTSNGWLYPLTVSDKNVLRVEAGYKLTELPPKEDVEGLSVQKLGDRQVIVWGHRGAGTQPGLLYYGLFDPEKKRPSGFLKEEINDIEFPSRCDPYTRSIADLKVDAKGNVWASATYDPGDNGPFVSAIYNLGVLDASKTPVRFKRNPDRKPLWTFTRKVEAIEFVPGPDGGIAFGAEDENLGGWLYFK